jgi:hypothetical protein
MEKVYGRVSEDGKILEVVDEPPEPPLVRIKAALSADHTAYVCLYVPQTDAERIHNY